MGSAKRGTCCYRMCRIDLNSAERSLEITAFALQTVTFKAFTADVIMVKMFFP